MEKYKTEGKQIHQVICDTRTILKSYKTKQTERLFNFKQFDDCTSIVTNKKTNYYVYCLYDLYGPFKTFDDCYAIRRLIRINTEAHSQAMVNSWSDNDLLGATV